MLKNKNHPVVLVEDDDAHAKLISIGYQKSKIPNTLIRLKNGDEVLDYVRKINGFEDAKRPQVILLDINIPGKNGIEVLRIIKRDENLKDIPIVILTTSRSFSDRQQAYLNYCNSYLVKPIDFKELEKLVKETSNYWCKWNVTTA